VHERTVRVQGWREQALKVGIAGGATYTPGSAHFLTFTPVQFVSAQRPPVRVTAHKVSITTPGTVITIAARNASGFQETIAVYTYFDNDGFAPGRAIVVHGDVLVTLITAPPSNSLAAPPADSWDLRFALAQGEECAAEVQGAADECTAAGGIAAYGAQLWRLGCPRGQPSDVSGVAANDTQGGECDPHPILGSGTKQDNQVSDMPAGLIIGISAAVALLTALVVVPLLRRRTAYVNRRAMDAETPEQPRRQLHHFSSVESQRDLYGGRGGRRALQPTRSRGNLGSFSRSAALPLGARAVQRSFREEKGGPWA